MKKQFTYLPAAAFFFMISCNNSNNSVVHSTNAAAAMEADSEMEMPEYYDLKTNMPVDVMEDSNAHQYVDVSTQKPLDFYYDAVSRDTFDIHGRIINNALLFNNGEYSIVEAKVKSNEDVFKMRKEEIRKKMEKVK